LIFQKKSRITRGCTVEHWSINMPTFAVLALSKFIHWCPGNDGTSLRFTINQSKCGGANGASFSCSSMANKESMNDQG